MYRAVVSGLDNIQAAIDTVSGTSPNDQLTIACTHEISHLYLLPRFDQLQTAIGKDRPIRIMTYEYDTMESSLDPRIDVVIGYDVSGVDASDRVRLVGEAVRPVASPAFIEKHQRILAEGAKGWKILPFLDLSKHNYGWATWKDWFEATANPWIDPEFEYFSNYVYLLEAAAAGRGLALGWQVLVDRHLENGSLQAVADDYAVFDRAIYAMLTPRGRNKGLAQLFLKALDHKRA